VSRRAPRPSPVPFAVLAKIFRDRFFQCPLSALSLAHLEIHDICDSERLDRFCQLWTKNDFRPLFPASKVCFNLGADRYVIDSVGWSAINRKSKMNLIRRKESERRS
jgi:hypothetical protein